MNVNAKTKYILEIPIMEIENKKETLVEYQNTKCDFIGLKFSKIENIEEATNTLKGLLPFIEKPLMVRGCGDDSIDKELLPALISQLPFQCIVAHANENTYKNIVPAIIKENHKLVIRTPIDINLCKEMNILASDMGLNLDNILIDTDIGGLGYGLEYGYSIIEKIKLEGIKGDRHLNLPIISFVAEETAKTKEAKNKTLAPFLEIASAAAVKAAGADYIVINDKNIIEVMESL